MSIYKIKLVNAMPKQRIAVRALKSLAELVLAGENIDRAEIQINLVDDAYMIHLNRTYLKKESTTDVLAFDLSEDTPAAGLEGEIYIGVEQVQRQASDFEASFENELQRMVVHGILHLIGFDDGSEVDRKLMTQKEDDYLTRFIRDNR
ncbi:MAG: rRNA maturation RNase YbeY [candidate division KSB1 bacterium]|nr:rRNA maturation RNase YbeY [candidate division KSB1 bacterium]MDZ7341040.1 rRNA maturation RNase YbeY [candidate division KSB1 bacterium]